MAARGQSPQPPASTNVPLCPQWGQEQLCKEDRDNPSPWVLAGTRKKKKGCWGMDLTWVSPAGVKQCPQPGCWARAAPALAATPREAPAGCGSRKRGALQSFPSLEATIKTI